MKAERVVCERIVFGDGAIIDIKVWRVPAQMPGSKHFLKYLLFYGKPALRLICYDNERGKGDHRHYDQHEERYGFISIEQMLADFRSDVEKLRGERI
ncbi:toxin-antitoxin system TumE family protein [Rhizobium sullae]|nr:DUF6516 family protein [Rhizobium sullae]PKA40129.1 hypothetical protein CWR43_26290 [Rhizobium sullae]